MGGDKSTDGAASVRPAKPVWPSWSLLVVGLMLMAVGVSVAAGVERAGGVRVEDVRFKSADGTRFSGLLYTPRDATPQSPAPGILAVHGYINTRETQSGFAIEFARRGYVVLALDERGHGYSGGVAMSKGLGGPEGLAFLRALPTVNPNEIGLEGHSLGGVTVLAAAAAFPAGYKALVLEGSLVGPPLAPPGTLTWPRNLAVVFGQFDEFAPMMWGVTRGRDVGTSPKLRETFGASGPVVAGRLYGDKAAGTARILYSPLSTHAGEHISTVAIGEAADWFATTLHGGTPRAAQDQIWWWKEASTGLALVGFFVFVLGVFDALLRLPLFAGLREQPSAVRTGRGLGWWGRLLMSSFVPPLSFFAINFLSPPPVVASALFPQQITNWLMVWAVGNAALALLIGFFAGKPGPRTAVRWGASIAIAIATVAAGYTTLLAASLVLVDFRFWVVALKPLSGRQAVAALAYLVPFTTFVLVSFRGLTGLMLQGASRNVQYGLAIAALALGFFTLTGAQYVYLFATGGLPPWSQALNVIIAIQFVPVLSGLAILAVYTWRRTGSYVPGGLIAGLIVTWYMVAGTATHFTG